MPIQQCLHAWVKGDAMRHRLAVYLQLQNLPLSLRTEESLTARKKGNISICAMSPFKYYKVDHLRFPEFGF
jgi:hypothetical protein